MSDDKRLSRLSTPVAGRLQSKAAIVTGAAKGIGRAIAVRLAAEGASVVIADVDEERAAETQRQIESDGGLSICVGADVSCEEQVTAMTARCVERFGGIDVLVNNAGIIVFGSLLDCKSADWDRMMAVDLAGAFKCTQAAARQMIGQGRGGRLIHIGSTASLLPAPEQAAYCIAKAGLAMLSRMAALEWAPHSITSNLLCPLGAVTDINRELLSDPKVMSQLESQIPVGRLATVEEIAAVVAFLASDEAEYITGTEFVHDGGVSISGQWWR